MKAIIIFSLIFALSFSMGFIHFSIPKNEKVLGLYVLKSLRISFNDDAGFVFYVRCNNQKYSRYLLDENTLKLSTAQYLNRGDYDLKTNLYPFNGLEEKWLEYTGAALAGISGASSIRYFVQSETPGKSLSRTWVAILSMITGYSAGAWTASNLDPGCEQIDAAFREDPNKYTGFIYKLILQSVDEYLSDAKLFLDECTPAPKREKIVEYTICNLQAKRFSVAVFEDLDYNQSLIESTADKATIQYYSPSNQDFRELFILINSAILKSGVDDIQYIYSWYSQEHSDIFQTSFDIKMERFRADLFLILLYPILCFGTFSAVIFILFERKIKNADDLKKIRGIGPVFQRKLKSIGVTRYNQISSWSEEDVENIEKKLNYRRVKKDKWIEQAALLEKTKDY